LGKSFTLGLEREEITRMPAIKNIARGRCFFEIFSELKISASSRFQRAQNCSELRRLVALNFRNDFVWDPFRLEAVVAVIACCRHGKLRDAFKATNNSD